MAEGFGGNRNRKPLPRGYLKQFGLKEHQPKTD